MSAQWAVAALVTMPDENFAFRARTAEIIPGDYVAAWRQAGLFRGQYPNLIFVVIELPEQVTA